MAKIKRRAEKPKPVAKTQGTTRGSLDTNLLMDKATEFANKFTDVSCVICLLFGFLIAYILKNNEQKPRQPEFHDRPIAFLFESKFNSNPAWVFALVLTTIGYVVFKFSQYDILMLVASLILIFDRSNFQLMTTALSTDATIFLIFVGHAFVYAAIAGNDAFSRKWTIFFAIAVFFFSVAIWLTPEVIGIALATYVPIISCIINDWSLFQNDKPKLIIKSIVSIIGFAAEAFALVFCLSLTCKFKNDYQFHPFSVAEFKNEFISHEQINVYISLAFGLVGFMFCEFTPIRIVVLLYVLFCVIGVIFSPFVAPNNYTEQKLLLAKHEMLLFTMTVFGIQKYDIIQLLEMVLSVTITLFNPIFNLIMKYLPAKK